MRKDFSEIGITEIDRLIDEYIFDKRYRKIFRRKIYDNPTYEALSEEFDLSVRQVFNIVDKCAKIIIKKAK